MIRTDRQLEKTREQIELLQQGLVSDVEAPDVHPAIADAARRALQAQIDDLQDEIEEYEALRSGRAPAPDLGLIGQLHTNLIRARVAAGLSQSEVARLIGVDPQQVQRYEATDYAGASLARLQEIAAVLGTVAPRRDPASVANEATLSRRLLSLGLPKAVARRLVPDSSRAQPFSKTAGVAAEALGLTIEELLGAKEPVLATSRPGFKLPVNVSSASVAAYATYAHVLAELVAVGSAGGTRTLPTSPDDVHRLVQRESGVSFRPLVEFAWECGIAVLPLSDPGAFHAAFWDIAGRPVVVVKQGTRSSARWAFDLAHELAHVADHYSGRRRLPDGLLDDESIEGWAADPHEQRANRFAGRVLLGPGAEDMAVEASHRAGGHVEGLKRAVAEVAKDHNVAAESLANFVAFRLAQHGINWWGAATNMQSHEEDPWAVARDVLLAHLDFGALDEQSRGLIIRAVAD